MIQFIRAKSYKKYLKKSSYFPLPSRPWINHLWCAVLSENVTNSEPKIMWFHQNHFFLYVTFKNSPKINCLLQPDSTKTKNPALVLPCKFPFWRNYWPRPGFQEDPAEVPALTRFCEILKILHFLTQLRSHLWLLWKWQSRGKNSETFRLGPSK